MHLCPDEINAIVFVLTGLDIRYVLFSIKRVFGRLSI